MVPAAPQIGSIDLEGRKKLLKVLVLPAFHTLLDTQCMYSEFPFPLKPSSQLHVFQYDRGHHLSGFDGDIQEKKKIILVWVKTG